MTILGLPRNAAQIKERYLQDVRLAAIDAGAADPAVQPGSDNDFTGTAVANITLLGFANQDTSDRQRSVLTATGEELDDQRIADGLPEIAATPSTGRLVIRVSGLTTVPPGLQFRLPNGLLGQVLAGAVNPPDYAELDVVTIAKGTATRFPAGTVVTFIAPPTNLATKATVSKQMPLTGGLDKEKDENKRARILAARRHRASGGNRAFLREVARNALGSVQDAFIYSTLDGLGTTKIAPVRGFDRERNDYTRSLSEGALDIVRAAIHAAVPHADDITVQTPLDEIADFALQIEIPDSSTSGGTGDGWTDDAPWPPLVSADGGRVTIDGTSSDYLTVTVSAETSTSPVAGQTRVAWWSGIDRRFYFALVVSVAGSAGAWVLGLDKPFIDSVGNGPVLGDFLSPQAQHIAAYGSSWLDLFEALGPGENTASPGRARRWPFAAEESPAAVTRATLRAFINKHPEITDYEFSYAPVTSPTVPGDTEDAPNILLPRRFGVYPL